jgi:hypothetical protein
MAGWQEMRNVYTPGSRTCPPSAAPPQATCAAVFSLPPVLGRAQSPRERSAAQNRACSGDTIEPPEEVAEEDELSERVGCVAGNGT